MYKNNHASGFVIHYFLSFYFSENGEEDDEDDEEIGNEDLGHNDYEKVHDDPNDDPNDDTGDDPIWYWQLFMNGIEQKKPDIHQAVITNIFWLCHII